MVENARNKRRDLDVMKLMMTDFKVELVDKNNLNELIVELHGPKNSDYEGGVWKIRVRLTDEYPYKPPIIQFWNMIYHPNIEEIGLVCLDVFDQNWTAMFDLVNVFEIFLPQLLLYPNPYDPINIPAAKLLIDDKPAFAQRVKEYIERFAKPTPVKKKPCGDKKSYDPTTAAENSHDPTMAENSHGPTTAAENSNDPRTAENSDDPTTATENSNDPRTAAENSNDPRTAENSDDPTMAENSDDPTTATENSNDPRTAAENCDDPTTAENSDDPTTATENSNDPRTAAENCDDPTTAENCDDPTTAENCDDPTTAENCDDPMAKKSDDSMAKEYVDPTTPEKSEFSTSNGWKIDM